MTQNRLLYALFLVALLSSCKKEDLPTAENAFTKLGIKGVTVLQVPPEGLKPLYLNNIEEAKAFANEINRQPDLSLQHTRATRAAGVTTAPHALREGGEMDEIPMAITNGPSQVWEIELGSPWDPYYFDDSGKEQFEMEPQPWQRLKRGTLKSIEGMGLYSRRFGFSYWYDSRGRVTSLDEFWSDMTGLTVGREWVQKTAGGYVEIAPDGDQILVFEFAGIERLSFFYEGFGQYGGRWVEWKGRYNLTEKKMESLHFL